MFTPVFKSADPEFNHHAADLAAKLVLAMDEDEARVFTTMVVADILWDDIAKNQRTLQTHLNTVIAKRVMDVAKAADRVVSKRDGADFGDALVEISKATRNPYDWGYVFNESDFNRDPGSGRFRSKVRYTATKPIPNKIARSTPNIPNPEKTKHLSAQEKARYQQGYQQIANFLDTMRQSGVTGDVKTYVTVHDTSENRTYTKEVSGSEVPHIDPKSEVFVGIEARPTGLNVGGASFGLVSALGGSSHTADRFGSTMQAVDQNLPTFATDWTSAGMSNQSSSNQRLYDRLASGSRFLGAVAPAGSHLQMASVFGEFVGRQGPQAEKVLGPRARTTMYRYRGTEKKPDSELVQPYNRARTGGYSFDSLSPENQKKVRTLQRNAVTRYKNSHGGKITPEEAEQVRQVVLRRQFNVSQKDAAIGAEAGKTRAFQFAQAYLMSKVPDQKLYDLQLKSGHTPPSEGVIIDKEGKIVTQAIGYGDDHYLPFNLKNLAGLRGGEYIRTRSVGGPTTEDIYTGLVSGAKRLTVVSRSGTFTVEFDDTFRGTRRYNDKAARMVDRYGKILDAIKSEQVERQSLDPQVRGQIAADVESEMGWASPRAQRAEIRRREAEYKEHPTLTQADEEQIEAQVARTGGNEQQKQQVRATLRNDVLEQKAYNFRLNGDGYAAALSALKEQFPYYIKEAPHRPTREGRYEAATDQGYVKPRFNRPSAALEGYYDTTINGEGTFSDAAGNKTGKNRADRVDYQNARGRLTRVDETEQAAGQAKPEEAPAATGAPTPPTPQEVMSDRIATAAARQTMADRAETLRRKLASRVAVGSGQSMEETLRMSPEDFQTWYSTPDNQEKFNQALESVIRDNLGVLQAQEEFTAYQAARGLAGGQKWDPTRHLMSEPDTPYKFEGAPYMHGVAVGKQQQELQRVAGRSKVPGFGSLAELEHDDDFKEALRSAHSLRRVSDQLRQFSADPDERNSYLREIIRNDPQGTVAQMSTEQKAMLSHPEKVDQMIEDINRAWALRTLMGPPEKLTTSAGTLQPTGQTIQAVTQPTPAQRAVQSVTSPESRRRQNRIYSEALGKLAQGVEDDDLAEALTDIASAYDAARYSPNTERDSLAADVALENLRRDYPQMNQTINTAIMEQFRDEK